MKVFRIIFEHGGKTTWRFVNDEKQARSIAESNGVAAEVKVNGQWVPLV
jgi:hypothetical protein